MSFEQSPPVPAGPPTAPIYRQDEFVRQPTAWTRPMQLGVAAYFIISTLYTFIVQLAFATEFKSAAAKSVEQSFRQSGRAFTAADVDSAVNLGMTVGLVFGVILFLVFVVLAILTVTGTRTWVFWVDVVVLALGVTGLIGVVASFTDPGSSPVPSGLRPIGALVSLVDLGLLVWMIVGLVRFGPWAQEKVPAAL